jgi:hypothetical protein
MNIKFNVVTWYSKLLSILFFIGVLPVLTFYIGTQYELTTGPDVQIGQSMSMLASSILIKKQKADPKIDMGGSALQGKVFGKIQSVYEKDGRLWVNIDPADQVSQLECVFRAYDAGLSKDCTAPDGNIVWNISTSTISMPLSEKATLSVYYNDGTKIGLTPKVINSKNGKLYSFALSASATGPASSSSSSTTAADLSKRYNRILSYDGDDTYRWNPLMQIEIKSVEVGSSTTSEVSSIEEVWKP